MPTSPEGGPEMPEEKKGEQFKIVETIDYRITAPRLQQWLETIKAESGVECFHVPDSLKGRLYGLEICVDAQCDDADVAKVRETIERHRDELEQLIKESRKEVGDTE